MPVVELLLSLIVDVCASNRCSLTTMITSFIKPHIRSQLQIQFHFNEVVAFLCCSLSSHGPSTSPPAVVIDIGTRYTKMGFSGNVEPCFIAPTVVLVNESFITQSTCGSSKGSSSWLAQHNAGVMADLDFCIGEKALSKSRTSSTYNLTYPIKHGQVENWDAMEQFWQQCIFNYMRCDHEDHYFLLTESPLTPPESREYTGEIMFETFNVPGLYIAVQPILALVVGYTTSKCEMTSVVVDVGDGATHVVPMAEGYVIGST